MLELAAETRPPVRLDIGCGTRKKDGFIGIDKIAFEGVNAVLDVARESWPYEAGSVDEAHCCHMLEHLMPLERIHFANELWRVMKVGAKCQLIAPHWSSGRAYGDPTHQWPPIAEWWFFYLKRDWRLGNGKDIPEGQAPHTDIKNWAQGFNCNFETTWGFMMNPVFQSRNAEYQQYAMNHLREAALDINATLTKIE